MANHKFALITGASSGIGFELAHLAAENGYDLLIASDQPDIENTARQLRRLGVGVDSLQCDLATMDGVDRFYGAAAGRPIGVLCANAGHGLGKAFVDQSFKE